MSTWWDSTVHSSPWIFQKATWERKFQDWSLSFAEERRHWILLAAIPFSLQRAGSFWEWLQSDQPGHSFQLTSRFFLDSIFRCGGMVLMVLHVPGERLQVGAAKVSRMVLAARFLGCCVLFDITSSEVMQDDLQVLEMLLRWFVISALAIPTFEEQTMWIALALGLDMLLHVINEECGTTFRNQVASSKMPLVLGVLYLLISYWFVSTKRKHWFRMLATSTLHVDDTLQGTASHQVTRVGSSAWAKKPPNPPATAGAAASGSALSPAASAEEQEWHDDYFTPEDWEEVKDEAAREQEAMLRRGLVQQGLESSSSYKWIHSNRMLGQGAHGKVRLVKNRTTGELHAMKTFRLQGDKEETAAKIAEREGTLLRMLEHPNIVRFAEEVQLEGFTLLVMELCNKGSVAWWIDSFGPLDERATQWITSEILHALRYLHLNAISHNDLKVANCLLTTGNTGELTVKIADFSTSTWKAQGVRIKIEGTVSYLPPEIADEKASRRRMDIWSLGICVLEMLTGSPAIGDHENFNVAKTIGALLSMRSDPVLPPSVPEGMAADFIRACLRFHPAERATAHQLTKLEFIADVDGCPVSSPTIRCILDKDCLELSDLLLKETLLLPRLRRQALFWFSPSAIWSWLVQLERPFLNPSVEAEFHSELSNNVLLDRVCMVIVPIYFIVNMSWTYSFFFVSPISAAIRAITQAVMVWAHTIETREFRMTHREFMLNLRRVGIAIRIASLRDAETRSIIAWTPIGFAVLILTSFLLPTVAEALLWTAAMVVMVTYRVLLDLRRDAAEGDGSGGWLKIGDKALQAFMVIATCCAMQTLVVIQARLELRSRFRQTLRKRRSDDRAHGRRNTDATWSNTFLGDGSVSRQPSDSTDNLSYTQSDRISQTNSVMSRNSSLFEEGDASYADTDDQGCTDSSIVSDQDDAADAGGQPDWFSDEFGDREETRVAG